MCDRGSIACTIMFGNSLLQSGRNTSQPRNHSRNPLLSLFNSKQHVALRVYCVRYFIVCFDFTTDHRCYLKQIRAHLGVFSVGSYYNYLLSQLIYRRVFLKPVMYRISLGHEKNCKFRVMFTSRLRFEFNSHFSKWQQPMR